jgi:hypothetical protein
MPPRARQSTSSIDTDATDEASWQGRALKRQQSKLKREEENKALARQNAEARRRLKKVRARTDDGDGQLDDAVTKPALARTRALEGRGLYAAHEELNGIYDASEEEEEEETGWARGEMVDDGAGVDGTHQGDPPRLPLPSETFYAATAGPSWFTSSRSWIASTAALGLSGDRLYPTADLEETTSAAKMAVATANESAQAARLAAQKAVSAQKQVHGAFRATVEKLKGEARPPSPPPPPLTGRARRVAQGGVSAMIKASVENRAQPSAPMSARKRAMIEKFARAHRMLNPGKMSDAPSAGEQEGETTQTSAGAGSAAGVASCVPAPGDLKLSISPKKRALMDKFLKVHKMMEGVSALSVSPAARVAPNQGQTINHE